LEEFQDATKLKNWQSPFPSSFQQFPWGSPQKGWIQYPSFLPFLWTPDTLAQTAYHPHTCQGYLEKQKNVQSLKYTMNL
jgi:hypothetical protein